MLLRMLKIDTIVETWDQALILAEEKFGLGTYQYDRGVGFINNNNNKKKGVGFANLSCSILAIVTRNFFI